MAFESQENQKLPRTGPLSTGAMIAKMILQATQNQDVLRFQENDAERLFPNLLLIESATKPQQAKDSLCQAQTGGLTILRHEQHFRLNAPDDSQETADPSLIAWLK
jgi:hypothetical protein